MLKPERKAQWCGHDGASEFGPPGLSAAVHVWGSDPVPPAHACRSGARTRDCQISSGPATHTSGPRVGRTGWAGSGHDRDRDTSSIAPRAPRQPAPGAIESGCWPLVVPLVNSFYTSLGSVSASGPHIGPHRIGGAAAARLPVIHPETAARSTRPARRYAVAHDGWLSGRRHAVTSTIPPRVGTCGRVRPQPASTLPAQL